MNKKPELNKLAKRYQRSRRTIERWIKEGAPMHNAKAMSAWLAARRTTPTPANRPANLGNSQVETRTHTPGNPGAPAALRRLESAELEAYQRLLVANASNDAARIKGALGAYLAVSEALRKADVSVDERRRDAQETVPRATVQSMLSGLAWSLRIGHDQVADALAARLCPGDLIHASGQLREAYGNLLLTALGGLRGGLASTSLAWPGWALEALCEDPSKSFAGGLDNLAQRTRLLSAMFKAGCGDRAELDKLVEELGA